MAVPLNVTQVSTFDPHGDPSTVKRRWERWLRGFEIMANAAGCTHDAQRRDLLLHSAGEDVQDIFETLTDTGEDCKTAKDKLTVHFSINENVPYNRHVFRQCEQKEGQPVVQFVTRLDRKSVV
jgi:hypothetical protein